MRRFALLMLVLSLGLGVTLVACEDPAPVGAPAAPPPPAPGAAQPEATTAGDPGQAQPGDPGSPGPDAGVPVVSYEEEDFLEGDTRRDPFRNYAAMFKQRPVADAQREVIMGATPVEDMRLIAIISGVAQPRAMLLDANGVGFVVKRGDYVGRPEVVSTGSGSDAVPVTLNWRVDRIRGPERARPGVPARSSEVVLTREDPSAPGLPPLTRVIPLEVETTLPGRR